MKHKSMFGILVLFLFATLAGPVWSQGPPDNDVFEYPLMRPDRETHLRWIEEYENAPRAPMDPDIESWLSRAQDMNVGTSLSLLSFLNYIPSERNQASCGDCWVWAGTGVTEIAYSVQCGSKIRFSEQFLNSCKTGSYACCGGNPNDFLNFYAPGSGKGYIIPWSNTNASFQDGTRRCPDGSSNVSCGSIGTSPSYPINYMAVQTITTQTVSQDTAIMNIKNVLNSNKAVWFDFWLTDSNQWDVFRNFWNNQNESTIWDPDYDCGNNWNSAPNEGGGHAVLIVGYNDDDSNPANHYWIVLNSWGTTSGRPNGLFRMKMRMNYGCNYYYPYPTSYYSRRFQTLDITFSCLPPTSCPSLYFWNGNDFEFAAPLFPGTSTPDDPKKTWEYTDKIPVMKNVVASNDTYLFQIRENELENSFIDMVRLIIVDHSSDIHLEEFFMDINWYNKFIALLDVLNGYNYNYKVLSPLMAIHSGIGNVMDPLSYSDDWYVPMKTGDIVTIGFQELPLLDEKRDFIFISEGYYQSLK